MLWPFLLAFTGYVVVALAWRRAKRRWPVLVRSLEEWALPTVTILLIIGTWMVVT